MADIAKFAELYQRLPMVWESIQPHTWIWCLHCERTFRFIEAKIDPDDGLLMCGYWPECHGTALDYWPWSREEWSGKMGEQPRPDHWPEEPEETALYPLYA